MAQRRRKKPEPEQSKIILAIHEEYQEFLQMAIRSLAEHRENSVVFEGIIHRFGALLRDAEFWVPVFQHTSGLSVNDVNVRKGLWLDERTLPFFEKAYGGFSSNRQDMALGEVAYRLQNDMQDNVPVSKWFCKAVKDKLAHAVRIDNPLTFFREDSSKSNEVGVLETFLRYADASDIVYYFQHMIRYFGIGKTPEEHEKSVRDCIDRRMRINLDRDTIQRWNVEGVHRIASDQRRQEILEHAFQGPTTLDKMMAVFKNVKLKPEVHHKRLLTAKLLELDLYEIGHRFSDHKDYFDQDTVKARMLELYKKQCEPSPDDIVEMMMGNKRRGWGWRGMPIMMMEMPWMMYGRRGP